MMQLQILLATYNSERFLREQLDSILQQDCQDFQLLIRDGGSTDSTLSIVQEYQTRSPEKIRLIGQERALALENFSALLQHVDADLIMFADHDDVWMPDKISHLIMFADHDDVWMPDKISRSLKAYRELEHKYGTQTPLMVFTDTKVVDVELNEIAPSMIRYQHLAPYDLKLSRLLVQNVPNGNTMLFNRALAELARPIPPSAVMHDHWITLVAVLFGKIAFLDEPTLLYRQSGSNVYGAFHYTPLAFLRKALDGPGRIRKRFYQNVTQGKALLERFHDQLPPPEQEILEAFASLDSMSFLRRRRCILKHRIYKSGLLRNLGMLLIL